jgi:hypothetical protein
VITRASLACDVLPLVAMKAREATLVTVDSVDLSHVSGAGIWSADTVYDPQSRTEIPADEFKRLYGDVCRRTSCYDSKSGHFIDRDSWNERLIDRQ